MNKNLVPDLSSRELQAVCALAEEGSFLAAAIALDLSQPALTRTLQRVETALGVVLFRRSTRKVEITPAGQEFVALANRIRRICAFPSKACAKSRMSSADR